MPQCTYTGPGGRQCPEPASDDNPFCFWHDRNAPKTDPDIKEKLEQKARNQESMEGYELSSANLEDAYLMEADLSHATLTRANLKEAVLEGADLLGVNLDNADLERAKWGPRWLIRNHLEAEELESHGDQVGAQAKYLEAEEIYRSIRKSYETAGTADIAGDFFHLEMVMKRKLMPLFSFARFWSKLVDLTCGYGEIPYRIIGSSMTYILFNAVIFCIFGMRYGDEVYAFHPNAGLTEDLTIFGYALYYSVVTFTTLGYGDFTPVGWSRPFAALEAFNGAFMIALFVLAFVKKMTR